jgi:hypothetical protein
MMDAMTLQRLRYAAAMIAVLIALSGTCGAYAQEADWFKPLREQVSRLYDQGKYVEAIPMPSST